MTQTATHRTPPLDRPPPWRSAAAGGALLGLVAVSMALATTLFAYAYLGVQDGGWPPPGLERPALGLPLAATGLLAASAAAAFGLQRAAVRGAPVALQVSCLAIVALGSGFLVVQGWTYRDLPVDPATHAYGSVFVLAVGLHHALALGAMGAAGLLVMQVWDRPVPRVAGAAAGVALLWFAVVGWWVLIAGVLYGSPLLWGGG